MSETKSAWQEIYEHFYETYFSPDLSAIQNFDTTDVQRFIPLLVVGICIGIFLATCFSYYIHQYLGRVVRRLYRADAFSPEQAKSLAEIGCDRFLIRRSLSRDTVLAKYVKPVGTAKDKDARFFIVEEDKYTADKRFKEVRGGWLTILAAFIICTVACFVLLYIIPDVLQLADNAVSLIRKD